MWLGRLGQRQRAECARGQLQIFQACILIKVGVILSRRIVIEAKLWLKVCEELTERLNDKEYVSS